MNFEHVEAIIAEVENAKELWNEVVTPEIKQMFKVQHDAYLANDHTIRIADGLPQFYSAMEHGESGLLAVIGEQALGEIDRDLRRRLRKRLPAVTHDGEIDGEGKYEKHDLGWVKALLVFLHHLVEGEYEGLSLPTQRPGYTPTVISNHATIAIIGDWGTGYWEHADTPAAKVADVVNGLEPDIVIHLGDAYYDGSRREVDAKIVNIIPEGKTGTYNLNSNHDMYSAAKPYFDVIKKPPFGAQGDTSYFALTNDHWVMVGLDTAYLSSFLNGFMYGTLGRVDLETGNLIPNEQTVFLTAMAQSAEAENKKLMIMSHHNAFDGAGLKHESPIELLSNKTLWDQVSTLIEPYLKADKVYWYWGHAHCAYTLKEMGNIYARCVGHSAVPWGKGSDFFTGDNSNIEWFEDTPMSGNAPLLVNGLMSVVLSDSTITEAFHTQDGKRTYLSINGEMQEIKKTPAT